MVIEFGGKSQQQSLILVSICGNRYLKIFRSSKLRNIDKIELVLMQRIKWFWFKTFSLRSGFELGQQIRIG